MSDTYGSCEYCNKYCTNLDLVDADAAFFQGHGSEVMRNYFRGPVSICNQCKYNRPGRWKMLPVYIAETYMKASSYLKDRIEFELGTIFLSMKDKVESISHIYVIPKMELPEEYRGSLNICIGIAHFSALAYTAWSIREHQSVMNLWTGETQRSKFWKPSITRLLIALGRLDSESDNLNIWIKSYGRRVFHINHFVRPPGVTGSTKEIVSRLIRLEK